MTTVAEQRTRIQLILQETDASHTRIQQIAVAHQEELQRLARQNQFGNITWFQGIAGQALYTLPTEAIYVNHVVYNEQTLRFVSERTLDRRYARWEALTGDPQYWTFDNQAPNVIRLIPQPVRTGSDILNPLFAPLPQYTVDNLVVFLYEDISSGITDLEDDIPTLQMVEDVLVYRSVVKLAMRETPTQNVPVAQAYAQLAELVERLIHGA